jgi:hypothetical protein
LEAALRRALSAVSVSTERERLRGNVLARLAHYTYAQATTGLLNALRAVPVRAR